MRTTSTVRKSDIIDAHYDLLQRYYDEMHELLAVPGSDASSFWVLQGKIKGIREMLDLIDGKKMDAVVYETEEGETRVIAV